jgi:3D (Asp-Asp-Asp) domain-containing protein
MKKLLLIPLVLMLTAMILSTCDEESKPKKEVKPKLKVTVRVTTYTTDPKQTDDTPLITASGFKLHPRNPRKHRIIAVSRDLKKKLKFGQYVRLDGAGKLDGVYIVQDVMNKRFRKRIDVLLNPNDKPTMYKKATLTAL